MKKVLLAIALVIAFSLAVAGRPAHASTQDFVVNNFTADYTLNNNDKQGQLHAVESIQVTFSDFNHGIYRALPNTYKKQSLELKINSVSSPSGAPSQFTTYNSNGNTVLKIGDPNRTVTGEQRYVVDYTVSNVIGFYNDHQELYWNINGTQWEQPFDHVAVKVHVPKEAGLVGGSSDATSATCVPNNTSISATAVGCKDQYAPRCFTGEFGATTTNCTVQYSSDTGEFSAETSQSLPPRQTLTLVLGFKGTYFMPPTKSEKRMATLSHAAAVAAPLLIVGGYSFTRWRKYGRDAKGKGIIVPEYEPPSGMRPAEVGALLSFKAGNKELSASIIDLAIRGYIKIIETNKKHLISSSKEYILELTNDDVTGLLPYERTLLEGLFGDVGFNKGNSVALKDLQQKFYTTASLAKTQISSKLKENGYFSGGSTGTYTILVAAAIITGMAGYLAIKTGYVYFGVGCILAVAVTILFAVLMPARTAKGVTAKDQALGLKLYLKTAEADRIKMLQSPNAPYAASTDAPVKTVQLFEKLLPYAIIFGVEKEWASEFKDIYTQPPNWYSGTTTNFNSLYLASALSGSMQAGLNTAFAAPSSSGSSGFGGGGFSGGGGGGGGGGGW